MARPITPYVVSAEQAGALRRTSQAPSTPQRVAQRARLLWHRLEGCSQEEEARRVGLARHKGGQGERRLAAQGLAGLEEAKGRGRKRWLAEDKKAVVITEVTRPPKGQARWTVRRMALRSNSTRQDGPSITSSHLLNVTLEHSQK